MKLYLKPLVLALGLAPMVLVGCGGGSDEASNTAPTIAEVQKTTLATSMDKEWREGFAVDIAVPSNLFEDADGDSVTISAGSEMVKGVVYENGRLTGTLAENGAGKFIHLLADDGNGGTTEIKLPLSAIGQPNAAPAIIAGILGSEGLLQQKLNAILPLVSDKEIVISDLDPKSFFNDAEGDEFTVEYAADSAAGLTYSEGTVSGVMTDSAEGQFLHWVATDKYGAVTNLKFVLPTITHSVLTVLDGYIENADICIDANNKDSFEAGECIEETTDVSGQLLIENSKLGGLIFVTAKSRKAIDSDHGDFELEDDLMLYAFNGQNVITPLTTMAVNIAYAAAGGVTPTAEQEEAAIAEVLAVLNPANSDAVYTKESLVADYVAKKGEAKYAKLYIAAQALADASTDKNFPYLFDALVAIKKDIVSQAMAKMDGLTAADLASKWLPVTISGSSESPTATVSELASSITVDTVVKKQMQDKLDGLDIVANADSIALDETILDNVASLFPGVDDSATYKLRQVSPYTSKIKIRFALDSDTNSLKLTSTPKSAGTHTASITATSAEGFQYKVDFSVVVTAETQPSLVDSVSGPFIEAIKNATWELNKTVSVEIPDGLFEGEGGAKVTLSTGAEMLDGVQYAGGWRNPIPKVSGAPSVKGVGHKVHLVATDQYGGKAELKIDLPEIAAPNTAPTVNEAVKTTLNTDISKSWAQGDSWNISVPEDLFVDSDGEALTVIAGDSMVNGISYENSALTGTLQASGDQQKVHLVATDPRGGSVELLLTIGVIASDNNAPIVKDGADETTGAVRQLVDAQWPFTQNTAVTVAGITADLMFEDPDGDDLVVTLGASSVAGLTYANDILSGTPTESGSGQKLVFVATDPSGASATVEIPFPTIEADPALDKAPVIVTEHKEAIETAVPAVLAVGDVLTITVSRDLFEDPEGDMVSINAGPDMAPGLSFSGLYAKKITGTLTQVGAGQYIHLIGKDYGDIATELKIELPEVIDAAIQPVLSTKVSRDVRLATQDRLTLNETITISLAGLFTDPNAADTLTLSAGANMAAGLEVTLSDDHYILTGAVSSDASGQNIHIVATDGVTDAVAYQSNLGFVNHLPVFDPSAAQVTSAIQAKLNSYAASAKFKVGSLIHENLGGFITDQDSGGTTTLTAKIVGGSIDDIHFEFNTDQDLLIIGIPAGASAERTFKLRIYDQSFSQSDSPTGKYLETDNLVMPVIQP